MNFAGIAVKTINKKLNRIDEATPLLPDLCKIIHEYYNIIEATTSLPINLCDLIQDYYDFKPFVKQVSEDYLPLELPKELLEDLNIEKVVERAAPIFEKYVQDMSCVVGYEPDLDPRFYGNQWTEYISETLSIYSFGATTAHFFELFPTIQLILKFSLLHQKYYGCPDADYDASLARDKIFFTALFRFCCGAKWDIRNL